MDAASYRPGESGTNHSSESRKKRVKPEDFNLTPEYLESVDNEQGGRCYWTGVKLRKFAAAERDDPEYTRNPFKPSIDRLDGNVGYSQDNVVLACMAANLGRNSIDPDEYRQILNSMARQLTNAEIVDAEI